MNMQSWIGCICNFYEYQKQVKNEVLENQNGQQGMKGFNNFKKIFGGFQQSVGSSSGFEDFFPRLQTQHPQYQRVPLDRPRFFPR